MGNPASVVSLRSPAKALELGRQVAIAFGKNVAGGDVGGGVALQLGRLRGPFGHQARARVVNKKMTIPRRAGRGRRRRTCQIMMLIDRILRAGETANDLSEAG
jgi:hypothetical protein